MNTDLDKAFQRAIEQASQMTQAELPQDTQLRLYAYFKQGSLGSPATRFSANHDLRNAFKTNAWMQISYMSPNEAKQRYIDLVNSLLEK